MRDITLDLARFGSVQESSFFDSCTVNTVSTSKDSYGELIKTYTAGSPIQCSFTIGSANEKFKDALTVNDEVATIYLPLGTSINNTATITLTRIGIVNTYEVLGTQIGLGVLIVSVKKIEV
jgi:hypothetical protein